METKVTAKHMDLTPAIEEYVTKKTSRLPRYFDRVQEIQVLIDKARNGYTVEVIVDVERHDPFISQADHDDLYAAIDLVVDRSTRQLTDHKSKLRDSKHHTPTSGSIKA